MRLIRDLTLACLLACLMGYLDQRWRENDAASDEGLPKASSAAPKGDRVPVILGRWSVLWGGQSRTVDQKDATQGNGKPQLSTLGQASHRREKVQATRTLEAYEAIGAGATDGAMEAREETMR